MEYPPIERTLRWNHGLPIAIAVTIVVILATLGIGYWLTHTSVPTLIKQLESCDKARSVGEYAVKKKIAKSNDRDGIKRLNQEKPIRPTIAPKMSDVGGWFYGYDLNPWVPYEAPDTPAFSPPIFRYQDYYCPLTPTNAAVLYRPIARDEALEYLKVLRDSLGLYPNETFVRVITDPKQYDDSSWNFQFSPKPTSRKVTMVEDQPDGYVVRLVVGSQTWGSATFTEKVFLVKPDGTIKLLNTQPVQ